MPASPTRLNQRSPVMSKKLVHQFAIVERGGNILYKYITIKHGIDAETKGAEERRAITGQRTMRPDRSYFSTPTIRKSAFGFVDTQPALKRSWGKRTSAAMQKSVSEGR